MANTPLSLEELERSLSEDTSIDARNPLPSDAKSPISTDTKNPTISAAKPPPGLVTRHVTSAPIELSHISPDDVTDEGDGLQWVMTERERRLISRVHFAQIKVERPDVEDYYYIHFNSAPNEDDSKPTGREDEDDLKRLLFPMPTRRQRPPREPSKAGSEDAAPPEMALFGRQSKSTTARPRQQLTLPPMLKAPASSSSAHFRILLKIEELYSVSLGDRTLQDVLKDQSMAETLPAILAFSKGQRALKAVLSLPPLKSSPSSSMENQDGDNVRLRVLEAFVDGFELLPASRPKVGRAADVDALVASVFTTLAPLISDLSANDLIGLGLRWLRKRSLTWLIYGRLGVIFSCMLMSRVEMLKETADPNSSCSSLMDEYQAAVRAVFNPSGDVGSATSSPNAGCNVNDIFEFAAPPGTSDFYVWQLLALVAVNLDRTGKRAMVSDLRERIMVIVQGSDSTDADTNDVGDLGHMSDSIKRKGRGRGAAASAGQERLATLNLFLNAIGLDASQLRGASASS